MKTKIMEYYEILINFVDQNILYCLIPIILTLILIRYIYKNKSATSEALNVIRWFIISYTIITLAHFLIQIAIQPDAFVLTARATGPYKIIYWFMLASALLVPFTLLIKKLAIKFWYVLLVAFLMKIGFYFERFVLFTTDLSSDYEPRNNDLNFWDLPLVTFIIIILKGISIAYLILFFVQKIGKKYN